MIKVVCNKCGEEINSQQFACEIKTTLIKEIFFPSVSQNNKNQIMKQSDIKFYHLCFNCWNKITEEFKE